MSKFIAARLSARLQELKMTQKALACSTGIRASSISDYVNGKNAPKYEKLLAIADSLGVNPTWLVESDAPKFLSASSSALSFFEGDRPYITELSELLERFIVQLERNEKSLSYRHQPLNRRQIDCLLREMRGLIEQLDQLNG